MQVATLDRDLDDLHQPVKSGNQDCRRGRDGK